MKVAVLGAGHGAFATCCYLTQQGFLVNLFEGFDPRTIEHVKRKGGIEFTGALGEGFAEINKITSDIREATERVDIIMVVVSSLAHEFNAKKVARYFQEEQLILLMPGHTGGSLHFFNTLKKEGVKSHVILCETNTLPYITRKETSTRVRIFEKGKNILFSAFPSKNFDEIYEKIRDMYSGFVPAENVLETGLMNDNALLHPAPMILNTGWIEHTRGDFYFYSEGITPSMARIMESVEDERLKIARAFGLKQIKFLDWWQKTGRTTQASDFYEAVRTSEPNKTIKAPGDMSHRFLEEDIKFGLVPMAYFARICDVSTPTMDSLIHMASIINGVDYLKEGLTPEKMGIEGLDVEKIKIFLKEGKS